MRVPHSITIFSLVTLSALIIAIMLASSNNVKDTLEVKGALLPGLKNKISTVTEVDVYIKDKSLSIKLDGGKWVIAAKYNYPVDLSKLRDVMSSLPEIEKMEAKTSDPTNFVKLAVENPDKNANSVRYALRDKDNKIIADIVIGKPSKNNNSSDDNMVFYAREFSSNQVWQVKGPLAIDNYYESWVHSNVFAIKYDRIKQVSVTYNKDKDGGYLIYKDQGANMKFQFFDKKGNIVAKSEAQMESIAGALSIIKLIDVTQDSKVNFPADNTFIDVFETYDGLKVTVKSADIKDNDPVTKNKKYQKKLITYQAEALNNNKDIKDEVDHINKQASGWAFVAFGENLNYLSMTAKDLSEK